VCIVVNCIFDSRLDQASPDPFPFPYDLCFTIIFCMLDGVFVSQQVVGPQGFACVITKFIGKNFHF
jgi:hypothetical protein